MIHLPWLCPHYEGGSWNWRKKIPEREKESAFPQTVGHKDTFSLWGPITCFSPHILINIRWAITIWLPQSLWCWVSWVTTFSTGCRSNESVPAGRRSFLWAKQNQQFQGKCGHLSVVISPHLKCKQSTESNSQANWSLLEGVASNHSMCMWNA